MALEFECNECGESIVVRHLKIGDEAVCSSCKAITRVPDDARQVNGQRRQRPAIPKPATSDQVDATPPAPVWQCPRCSSTIASNTPVCPACNLAFASRSVYSPKHFVLFSALFSYIVPLFMAFRNWNSVGRPNLARNVFFGGLAFYSLLLILVLLVDDIPGGHWLGYLVNIPFAMYLKKLNTPLFEHARALGFAKRPTHVGVFAGLGIALCTFALVLFMVTIFAPNPMAEANQFLDDGQYEKAAQLFEELLTEYPEEAAIYYNRALCYANFGKHTEAAVDLVAYIEACPDDPDGYYFLAEIREQQGKRESARRLVEIAESKASKGRKKASSEQGK